MTIEVFPLGSDGSGGGGGGVTNFLGLSDVPSSYTGQGGKYVKVLATENGLEFVAGSGATATWGDISGDLADQADLVAALGLKLSTSNVANRVYGTNNAGAQTNIAYAATETNDSLALRTADGQLRANTLASDNPNASATDLINRDALADALSNIEGLNVEEEVLVEGQTYTISTDVSGVIFTGSVTDYTIEFPTGLTKTKTLILKFTGSVDNLVIDSGASSVDVIPTKAIPNDAWTWVYSPDSDGWYVVEAWLGTSLSDAPLDGSFYGRKSGAWVSPSKSDVGLSNVDNTSDANKPISTATQLALDGKEDVGVAEQLMEDHTDAVDPHPQYVTEAEAADAAPVQSVAGKTGAVTLNKTDVGLGNVDNTSDADKPISIATQTALNGKEDEGVAEQLLDDHVAEADPHPQYTTATEAAAAAPVQSVAGKTGAVTLDKSDVGLSNVDNTSDADKPVSTATQTALDGKAPASHVGAGGTTQHPAATTSTAGFMSAADKVKLDGISEGATVNQTDAYLLNRANHTGTQTLSTISDAGTMAAQSASSVEITGGSVKATTLRETKVDLGAGSAIDLSQGNLFTKTISGSTTFTVTNVPATNTVVTFVLELTNGGSSVVTYMTGVKWDSGVAPTLTAAGVDILGFYTHDGGTTWRGVLLAKDSK